MIHLRSIKVFVVVLVIGVGFWLVGCCRDNSDTDCTGDQVCNMAISLGSIGICREPGIIDIPCGEDADCLEPYACDLGDSGNCRVPLGEACEDNEDCLDFEANSCLQGVCTERGWSCDWADQHDCREDAVCFCYGPDPCVCYTQGDE